MGQTSGNFITSDTGQSPPRLIFEWWETGSGISGAVGYHNISYHLKSYGGSTYSYSVFHNGSMNVDGAGYSWGDTNLWGGGATVFGDYSNTLYTDSSGNRSFGASAQGGIYTYAINTSGSGSWSLNNIPLHANITGATGDIDDEATTYYTTYNNPAGVAVDTYLDFPSLGIAGKNRVYNYGSGNGASFTTDIASIRTAMANVNSTAIRYVIHDTSGGSDSWSFLDYTLSIKNNTGQANPTFSAFTYADINSTTAAITGNDQYLIQGYSTPRVTVTTGNKATPNKNANMDHYTVTIGSFSGNATYSSSATVTKDIGVINDVTGLQTLSVKAVDSRTNYKTATTNATILPYAVPILNATVVRVNGFDGVITLGVTGSISPLTISSVDKNSTYSSVSPYTANRVEYRVSMDGGAYGQWADLAVTQTTGTGAITGTSQPQIAAAGSASSDHAYTVQVKVTDKLNTVIQTVTISAGRSIFRIGTDGFVYGKEEPLMPSHIGQVIMSTTLDTAAKVQAIYKGTWVAWGTGRAPIGVDTGQTEFNTVEKTGGSKTTTGSFNTDGGHYDGGNSSDFVNTHASYGPPTHYHTASATLGCLPPYITCYMWRRSV
jgi:hypothetical protein